MSDLIRREDAIDAVLELNTDGRVPWKDAVIDMLDALPSATCDDCIWHVCNYNKIDWDGEDGYISRQDAIEAIESNSYGMGSRASVKAIKALPSAEPEKIFCSPDAEWIPVSERLPDAEECPMDCMVTRKSKFVGNYVDMAVAEAEGTWTHEDWKAISYGDVESDRKTGLISTRDDEIIAWMPLIQPYREDGE